MAKNKKLIMKGEKTKKRQNKENFDFDHLSIKTALKNLTISFSASQGSPRHQSNILRLIKSYHKKNN